MDITRRNFLATMTALPLFAAAAEAQSRHVVVSVPGDLRNKLRGNTDPNNSNGWAVQFDTDLANRHVVLTDAENRSGDREKLINEAVLTADLIRSVDASCGRQRTTGSTALADTVFALLHLEDHNVTRLFPTPDTYNTREAVQARLLQKIPSTRSVLSANNTVRQRLSNVQGLNLVDLYIDFARIGAVIRQNLEGRGHLQISVLPPPGAHPSAGR